MLDRAARRILVVVTRRLADVLLATPLIASLRAARAVRSAGRAVPALQGCDRHVDSDPACLSGLPATRVIAAARALLT
ncbi:MAG: hypothetical protein H7125_18160 [Proteobacteria bacterium]|nr:hypothetical protein [Burkholderiales bacterium]